jgi:signal transduction histidine kinase
VSTRTAPLRGSARRRCLACPVLAWSYIAQESVGFAWVSGGRGGRLRAKNDRLSGTAVVPAPRGEVIPAREEVATTLRSALSDLTRSEQRGRTLALRILQIHEVTSRLASALTLAEVFETVLDFGERELSASAVGVFLDAGSGAVHLAALRGERASAACAIASQAIERQEGVFFESYDTATGVDGAPFGSFAALPLHREGETIGALGFGFSSACTFGPEDRLLLLSLAAQVSVSIERARLYDAARASASELAQTVRWHELFAGTLAHDLRNPLSAIMSAANLALMTAETDEPMSAEALATRVLRSGERMARMISQLLDVSRIRLGAPIALDRKTQELSLIVRGVIDELAVHHRDRSIELHCAGDTEGVWDREKLSQVFSNLITNALIHGARGEPVRVDIDGRAQPEIEVRVHNAGAIDPELAAHLFEPPHGSHRTRERASDGLGLGLFIVRHFVEVHGGRVEVRSSELEGTSFCVYLPRRA